MGFPRRSRSSSRAIRQYLLIAAAVAVIIGAACAPAWASEPPPVADGTLPPAPTQQPEGAAPQPAPVAAAPPLADWHQRRRTPETYWYGWQTLIADGTSLIVLPVVAGATQSEALLGMAVGGYFLAPPIIHAVHGRWGMTFASLGIRLGLPTVGILLGAAVDQDSCRDFCLPVGAAIGFLVGVGGAVTIDAALFSDEKIDTDERDAAAARAKRRGFSWTPVLGPRKEGGFDVGLGATF